MHTSIAKEENIHIKQVSLNRNKYSQYQDDK